MFFQMVVKCYGLVIRGVESITVDFNVGDDHIIEYHFVGVAVDSVADCGFENLFLLLSLLLSKFFGFLLQKKFANGSAR